MILRNRQMAWYTVGQIVTLFFQWLILMAIPVICDFSDAGIFSIAISMSSIFYTIASCYLHQVQLADQYKKYTEDEFFATRLITIAISTILLAGTLMVIKYPAVHNNTIVAYFIYKNVLNVAYIFAATLEINNRFDYVGKITCVEGIVSFISFITVYYVTSDIALATLMMAIVGGAVYLLGILYGRRKFKTTLKIVFNDNVKKLFFIGILTLITAISPIIINAMPKLVLEEFYSDEIVGIFSTLSAPTMLIPTIITSMFAPLIGLFSNVARKGDMVGIRQRSIKVIVVILLFGITLSILSFFIIKPILNFIYGELLAEYSDYFSILILAITFYSIGMIDTNILITKNQEHISSIISILIIAISTTVFVLLIKDNGLAGAVFGLLISYIIFAVLTALCVMYIPIKGNKKPEQIMTQE